MIKVREKKNKKYWEQHKEVFNVELEKLDRKSVTIIFDDPNGKMMREFAARVDQQTKKELQLS